MQKQFIVCLRLNIRTVQQSRHLFITENKLDVDAVIIDELSMVDIKLFDSFLEALPMSARLIMVGDKDQLPAVGAGNVLLRI